MCRSRSTGVDSGKSWRFSTGQEQDQEWIFLIGTGARAGAGVIFGRVFLTFSCIFAVFINGYTGVKQ